jgi:hypothetical protein
MYLGNLVTVEQISHIWKISHTGFGMRLLKEGLEFAVHSSCFFVDDLGGYN